MGKEEIKRLVEQYERNISTYKNAKEYNEQDCRDEFISPLLECFGWDVHNKKGTAPQYKEVVVEKFSGEGERPDYTLTLNGVSKMFVEAKKPAIDIAHDEEPALQARSYGWNAGHKLSILTNFEYLMIYDTTNQPKVEDSAATSLYRKYHYTEYVEQYEEICELISRESVYSGTFDAFINGNFQTVNRYSTEIDEIFLQQINEWRLNVGKYLYANVEKYQDIDVLNDVVQEFINQIIFLRICEDRNLPLYKKLQETVKDKAELKNRLAKVFQETDRRYNSGLFKGENVIFDLDNEIIYQIIDSLYYPRSPYLFNIIEPGLLGKIYEAFLAEGLVVNDGEIKLGKKNEYLYKSVVSTPPEVVKFMVKNTMDKVCLGKTPEEVLKLRVIDISCGSGVFLEEAYQYLVDYCTQWYAKHDEGYLLELEQGRKKLPLKDKKQLLVQCIYGVDIDIHAVEVSKFSMLLKLIEDETFASTHDEIPVLPDLTENIQHGNALISYDALSQEELSPEQIIKIVPYDWKGINQGEKFDLILGNPPYVKTEDIKKLHTTIEVNAYKQLYKSANKQYDKYYLFIEKAMDLLKAEGYLSFIVPNKFLHTESAEKLRKMMGRFVAELDDFGAIQLFKDKTVYSAILTISGKETKQLGYRSLDNVAALWGNTTKVWIEKKNLNSRPWEKREENHNEEAWLLNDQPDYYTMLSAAGDRIVPLSEIVEIYNGIQTSAEKIYKIEGKNITSEDEQYIFFKLEGKAYKIEKKILRPYFKPARKEQGLLNSYSDLRELSVNYNIFPYDETGKFIKREIMEKEFPNAWNYLLDHKAGLLPKSLGGRRDVLPRVLDENEWYRYGRSQAITILNNRKKIIVGVNRRKDNPLYLLDDDNYLIASGGTAGYVGISCLEGCAYALEYIHAWLTHPLTDLYLQSIGSDFEGGFIARGTYTLPIVPFIQLDFSDECQKALYDEVVSDTRAIQKLNREMVRKKDKLTLDVLGRDKKRRIERIEKNITRVYEQDFR